MKVKLLCHFSWKHVVLSGVWHFFVFLIKSCTVFLFSHRKCGHMNLFKAANAFIQSLLFIFCSPRFSYHNSKAFLFLYSAYVQ